MITDLPSGRLAEANITVFDPTGRLEKAAQSSVEALLRQMKMICDDVEVELPMMQTRIAERSHSDSEVFGISTELSEALIAIAKHVKETTEPTHRPISTISPMVHPSISQHLPREDDAIEDLLGDLE